MQFVLPYGGNDEQFQRQVKRLRQALLIIGSLLLGAEAVMGYTDTLGWRGAYLLTPCVVVLLMLGLSVGDTQVWTPWEGRFEVESDLARSGLMLLGALLVVFGGTMGLYSLGADVPRIVIDMGVGTFVVCFGVFVAYRYRW